MTRAGVNAASGLAALLAACRTEDEAAQLPTGTYDVEIVAITVRQGEKLCTCQVLREPDRGRRIVGRLLSGVSEGDQETDPKLEPAIDELTITRSGGREHRAARLLGRRFRIALSRRADRRDERSRSEITLIFELPGDDPEVSDSVRGSTG
jgi:hypothetical protein